MSLLRFAGILIIFFTAGFLFSCGNRSHNHSHDHDQMEGSTEHMGKEYTSTYVCPMHCEGSGGEETGECPVCGMEYVLRTEHEADGHPHEDDNHDGHNH